MAGVATSSTLSPSRILMPDSMASLSSSGSFFAAAMTNAGIKLTRRHQVATKLSVRHTRVARPRIDPRAGSEHTKDQTHPIEGRAAGGLLGADLEAPQAGRSDAMKGFIRVQKTSVAPPRFF